MLLVALAVAFSHDKADPAWGDATLDEKVRRMDATEAAMKEAEKRSEAFDIDGTDVDLSSLLQTAPKAIWTADDSRETEDLVSKSYKNIDKVQDDIIAAANQELKEQKKLPNLEQATHHWDAGKFNDGTAALPSSFVQTTPLEEEYEKSIDFSKLDKLRSKVDGMTHTMQTDFADLKVQTQRDEAFAKEQQQAVKQGSHSGSLAEHGSTWKMKIPTPKDVDTMMGESVGEEEAEGPMDADSIVDALDKHRKQEHTAQSAKLTSVAGKLALLERVMEAKKTGIAETPRLRALHQKLAALIALSQNARSLLASGAIEHEGHGLEALRKIKESIKHIRGTVQEHLADHLQHFAPESLVEKDVPDTGYGPIEKDLGALHDRIEKQVDALHATTKAETAAQVNALSENPATDSQYKFAWSQPTALGSSVDAALGPGSYAEIDASGNMRTH